MTAGDPDANIRERRQLAEIAVAQAERGEWEAAAATNRQLLELGEDVDAYNRLGKALADAQELSAEAASAVLGEGGERIEVPRAGHESLQLVQWDESGQDVSQEFVDLHARIRQLEAVEAQLLELLDRANDVPAALAVQSQLSQVQLDLEQARGRLNYLEDQVTYATISLSLHEAGVVAPRGGGFSIVDAWATAGAAFLTVVGWILVGVAVAAPLLVLAALGYVVARILRSRLAHT